MKRTVDEAIVIEEELDDLLAYIANDHNKKIQPLTRKFNNIISRLHSVSTPRERSPDRSRSHSITNTPRERSPDRSHYRRNEPYYQWKSRSREVHRPYSRDSHDLRNQISNSSSRNHDVYIPPSTTKDDTIKPIDAPPKDDPSLPLGQGKPIDAPSLSLGQGKPIDAPIVSEKVPDVTVKKSCATRTFVKKDDAVTLNDDKLSVTLPKDEPQVTKSNKMSVTYTLFPIITEKLATDNNYVETLMEASCNQIPTPIIDQTLKELHDKLSQITSEKEKWKSTRHLIDTRIEELNDSEINYRYNIKKLLDYTVNKS